MTKDAIAGEKRPKLLSDMSPGEADAIRILQRDDELDDDACPFCRGSGGGMAEWKCPHCKGSGSRKRKASEDDEGDDRAYEEMRDRELERQGQ